MSAALCRDNAMGHDVLLADMGFKSGSPPGKCGLDSPRWSILSVFARFYAFTNGSLNETCQIVNSVLQGVDGPATRSAGQGDALKLLLNGIRVPWASSSQQPGMTGANDSKSRGKTMIGICAGMKWCRAAMLRPCRSASRLLHPRLRSVSTNRPSTNTGVA